MNKYRVDREEELFTIEADYFHIEDGYLIFSRKEGEEVAIFPPHQWQSVFKLPD